MNSPATSNLEGLQFAFTAPAPDGRATQFQVLGYFSDRKSLIQGMRSGFEVRACFELLVGAPNTTHQHN